MKRASATMFLAVLLLAVTAVASPAPAGQKTFKAEPAVRVESLTGFTRARRTMSLAGEEAGRVVEVLADVGQAIPKSGVFARLDTTFIDLEIEDNAAGIKRLDTEEDYYERQRGRYEILVRNKTAAQTELDKLDWEWIRAEQMYQAVKVRDRLLRERRDRFAIKAPPGWKVIERLAEPGEWMAKGEKVAELGDYRTLLVSFALTQAEYGWLRGRKGPVALGLPELGIVVNATVERVSPSFDPATRKINVDLLISKGLPEMRGGLRCELDVPVPDGSGAVMVPASAVMERYDEYFLVRPDGERVKVRRLGRGRDGKVLAHSPGVAPGQAFLLEPTQGR